MDDSGQHNSERRLSPEQPSENANSVAGAAPLPQPPLDEPAYSTSDSSTERPMVDLVKLKRRSRWFMLGTFLTLLAIVGGIGAFIETDSVALMPGSARDTEPLIVIEGTETYPSEGELLFTTVRIRQNPNIWEYLWLSLDDDVEIVPEEVVLGDRTSDENRQINLQAMVDSQSIATAVALEQLGYEVIEPTGVIVAQVVDDTAADGILHFGEIIREIDGVSIVESRELVELLSKHQPGDQIELTIEVAEGELETRALVLGAKDDDPDAAFLGVAPQTLVDFDDLDVGFDVEIDSGSVGGPSAGLAFTLAILDELTPGELTGGVEVAVTGTMSVSGTVGRVGGVPQKTAAVRDLGIKFFIVPSALGEEAIAELREVAQGKVEIIPVDTLQDALEVLDGLGGEVSAIAEYAASVQATE